MSEKNIGREMNQTVERRISEYMSLCGMKEEEVNEQTNRFIRRCAVRNMEARTVAGMLKVERPELREILENMYCDTIYESVEVLPDDGKVKQVIITDWINAALDIAVTYKNYQGIPLILQTVAEIALKQPYSDYRSFFEKLKDDEEPLRLEKLLCLRNAYRMKNGEKAVADGINVVTEMIKISSEQIKSVRQTLPECFAYEKLKGQKTMLENDIITLETEQEEAASKLMELETEIKKKSSELEAKRIEELQNEKDRRMDELIKENERLRSRAGDEASADIRAYPAGRAGRFAITKTQRTRRLVDMMMKKHYSPEKIHLISEAKDNGADIKELIRLVECDADTGTLRETIRFLADRKKPS